MSEFLSTPITFGHVLGMMGIGVWLALVVLCVILYGVNNGWIR